MVRKSKGRQKIEMKKMKNESNLQVTFSKRRAGLFKKASELCTLCAVEMIIIVFSPGRKVFSFGHPNVETIIDRFLNNNARPLHQQNNIHLNEAHRDSLIQDLNALLTERINQFDGEKQRNKDIKKIRAGTKSIGYWWENPIETLDLANLFAYKTHLENLKNAVSLIASNFFQATTPHFYVGSSSNDAFSMDGGTNINPNIDMSNQRNLMDVNAFNQNRISPSHPLHFGSISHGSISQGFLPKFNMNYRPELPNLNQNKNPNSNHIFKREDFSGYEYQHGHYLSHSGPCHF